MKWIREFIRKWKAETPEREKRIRNFAISAACTVGGAWCVVTMIPKVDLPSWCGYTVAGVVFVCVLIGGKAGAAEIAKNVGGEIKQ